MAGCLLLTIPVDCLVAVTSWRRLRNKYNKHMQNSLRLQSSDYVTAAQRQLKNELHQDDEPFEEVSPMRCGILEGESHNSWSAKGSAKCNSYNLSSKTVNISSSNTSGSQHYSERNSDGAETQNRIATGCAADANSCDPTVDGSNTPGTIDVEANSTQVIDSNSETLDEDLRSSDSCHSATCRAGEWEDDVLPKVRSESSHKVRSSRLASSETLQSRKFLTDSWNSSVVIHSDGGSGSRHLSGWDFGLDGSEIVHSRGTGPAQTDSASYRDGSFVDLNLESTEGTESTRTHRTKKSCKSAIRQSFCSSYVAWNSLNRITCCAQEKSGVDLLLPRSSRRESIEIAITTIVLWGFAVGMNLLLGDSWMYLATTVGTISTAILVFIVPSTAYYRLGLASDFQAIPICGVIPNRALMFIVQIIGILLLLGNLAEVVYFNV